MRSHGSEGEHGALAAAEGFGVEELGFRGWAVRDGDVFGGGTGLDGDGVQPRSRERRSTRLSEQFMAMR